MIKMLFATLAASLALQAVADPVPARPEVPKEIKAYDIDFNWGPGGPNAFPKPGLWAEADPAAHVAWYKELGCNTIQTFCVSCNGYAWYKGGVVPEQPGLKYDFLPEVVRLAHQEKMLVFGYFCAGSNTRWGQLHPDQSYGIPSEPHIPYTDDYLAYLDSSIRDAVRKTGIDGFMVDWLRMPTTRKSNGNQWLDCEKKLYAQLMGEPFPGEAKLTAEQMTAYGRKAIDRTWETIRKAAKETNPNCLVWLTCCDINDPHIANSRALKETDWLLNEAGDLNRTQAAKAMIGPQTRLITCLALWNGQNPDVIIPAARQEGIGLYGFTKPTVGNLKPPISGYLGRPLKEFRGDDYSIAALARVFHGAALDTVMDSHGKLVKMARPVSEAKPISASGTWQETAGFEAGKANDGDPATRWGAEANAHSAWLEIDLGKPTTVRRAVILNAYPELKRIRKFAIEAWQDGQWKPCYQGENLGEKLDVNLPPTPTQRIRLNITEATDTPTLWEFQVFEQGV